MSNLNPDPVAHKLSIGRLAIWVAFLLLMALFIAAASGQIQLG